VKSRLAFLITIFLITAGGALMAMPLFSRSGVPQDALDVVAGYFQDANDRLKKVVPNPDGKTLSAQQFNQARAAQLIQQCDRVLLQLKGQTSGWVAHHMPQTMKDGLALADRQVQQIFKKVPADMLAKMQPQFALVDVRTVQNFALSTTQTFHKAADSMTGRAKEILRTTQQLGVSEKDINKVLVGGVIEGKPREAIRQLGDEMRQVHGDTVEINGKNYDVEKYAELVARTRTREATVTARHDRLSELGLDLVMIIGRLSTNFCSAFLNQVFSLSGTSDKYPSYASLPGGGPPFHPNCSKSTRPFVEELASEKQLATAEILPDAEKLLGMDQAQAQRSYQDLQIKQQVATRHATTEAAVF
jgi:hypothetical protein